MQRVLLLFPLIILAGAHSEAATGMMRLCKFQWQALVPALHHAHPIRIRHFELRSHPPSKPDSAAELDLPDSAVCDACTEVLGRTCSYRVDPPLRQQTGSAAIVNPNGRGWRMKECKLVSKLKRSQLGQRSDGQRTWVQ